MYYVYDAPPGQTAPVWNDACPTPPGPTSDGCVVRSKLDRYTVNLTTNVADPASRLNLIGDSGSGEWCQQFPSHAGGALAFDSDGMLIVSGGDGASFNGADWGQRGGSSGSPTPVNPCGDPVPGGVLATAEGGQLRSQDVRTQGDPTGLDGTLVRIDPDTGNSPADNPMKNFGGADANTKRIVATGFRNPFRMTFRPGHERPVCRRRRQRNVGGSRPLDDVGQRTDDDPELRLAVLRGRRQPGGASRHCKHEHVPGSLRRRPERAAVHVHARGKPHAEGPLLSGCRRSDVIDLGARVLRGRDGQLSGLSEQVRRRAVLRRLLARLPRRDPAAIERGSGSEQGRADRVWDREPGRPRHRAGRRPVLRGSPEQRQCVAGEVRPVADRPRHARRRTVARHRSSSTWMDRRRASPIPTSRSPNGTGTSTTTAASTPPASRSTGTSTPPPPTRSS